MSQTQSQGQDVGGSRFVKERVSVGTAYPPNYAQPDNYISIRHPGYDVTVDDRVELLRLPCMDFVDGRYGHHYGTAKSACLAVTKKLGNLVMDTSDTRTGDEEFSWDDLLAPGYYVYYPFDFSSVPRYLVYTNLESWTFESLSIPAEWNDAFQGIPTTTQFGLEDSENMSSDVHQRDIYCRVTGEGDAVDNTYVVDSRFSSWYWYNLTKYNCNKSLGRDNSVHDSRNGLLLRKDLHWTFDLNYWTFAVKEGAIVAHFCQKTSAQGHQWHNVKIAPLNNAVVPHFWTRFFFTFCNFVPSNPALELAQPLPQFLPTPIVSSYTSSQPRSHTSGSLSRKHPARLSTAPKGQAIGTGQDTFMMDESMHMEDLKQQYLSQHPNIWECSNETAEDETTNYPDYKRFGVCCNGRCKSADGRHWVL